MSSHARQLVLIPAKHACITIKQTNSTKMKLDTISQNPILHVTISRKQEVFELNVSNQQLQNKQEGTIFTNDHRNIGAKLLEGQNYNTFINLRSTCNWIMLHH